MITTYIDPPDDESEIDGELVTMTWTEILFDHGTYSEEDFRDDLEELCDKALRQKRKVKRRIGLTESAVQSAEAVIVPPEEVPSWVEDWGATTALFTYGVEQNENFYEALDYVAYMSYLKGVPVVYSFELLDHGKVKLDNAPHPNK